MKILVSIVHVLFLIYLMGVMLFVICINYKIQEVQKTLKRIVEESDKSNMIVKKDIYSEEMGEKE